MHISLIKKAAAESIGTFALVFFGCGGIMVHTLYPSLLPAGAVPVVFGLAVAAMIYAVGHISGAHFNPAVTLAFTLIHRFTRKELPIYWLAQCAGAAIAIFVLKATLPEAANFGATLSSLSIAGAFIWEAILSFILMFVITAVATDGRAVGVMAGAAIGGTVALAAFVGGPLTGASMNPARSLAPALFSGQMETLWLYLIAPCIGAAAGAFAYDAIRCDQEAEKTHAKGCC